VGMGGIMDAIIFLVDETFLGEFLVNGLLVFPKLMDQVSDKIWDVDYRHLRQVWPGSR